MFIRARMALSVLAIAMLPACSEEAEGTSPWHRSSAMQTHASEAASEDGEVPASNADRPGLGLMTSLPLYWPLGTDLGDMARGAGTIPWQRTQLERGHELVLLDTLSPIRGLAADSPDTDPLAGLERLAIVQPRGLSPADNVALDQWVRGGGHLLLVLDPLLTGEYDLPLGDPRRPTDAAVIPPVVERWGLRILFDERQEGPQLIALEELALPVSLAGEVRLGKQGAYAGECGIIGSGIAARCTVGKGRVTLIADAFAFELPADAGSQSDISPISDVLQFAFEK